LLLIQAPARARLPTWSGKTKSLPNPKPWDPEGSKPAAAFGYPILSLARESPRTGARGFDEHEKAGLLTSRSSYRLRLTTLSRSGFNGAFVTRYSGATARDFHPFPYSPPAMTEGTFHETTTKCGGHFKELHYR